MDGNFYNIDSSAFFYLPGGAKSETKDVQGGLGVLPDAADASGADGAEEQGCLRHISQLVSTSHLITYCLHSQSRHVVAFLNFYSC